MAYRVDLYEDGKLDSHSFLSMRQTALERAAEWCREPGSSAVVGKVWEKTSITQATFSRISTGVVVTIPWERYQALVQLAGLHPEL